MFGSMGMTEILVIFAIVALLFGPSQLPKLGKAMGETIKEFRGVGKAFTETADEVDEGLREAGITPKRRFVGRRAR